MWFKLNNYYMMRQDISMLPSLTNLVMDLPCPMKIKYFWNFGSLLGLTFFFQFISGLLLSMHYISDMNLAFSSVDLISREMFSGWMFRYIHVSGASMFFLFIYFHVGRGLYYGSFNLWKTWLSGVIMLILSMAIAFLGYVLPWGQMSYWGATVITNFFSVVPYMGNDLVIWIWGGFAVDYPTLTRFFSLHFFLPFMLILLMMIHLMFLHETGSNKPLGMNSKGDKISFFPLFALKDIFGFFLFFLFVFFFFLSPSSFFEFQNFLEAKPLVTPTHIQPEWYFLAAYAVLRSIPNKLGGVMALFSFILIYLTLPLSRVSGSFFLGNYKMFQLSFKVYYQLLFWLWVFNLICLSWLGACPVEYPFLEISRICSGFYFFFFFSFFM